MNSTPPPATPLDQATLCEVTTACLARVREQGPAVHCITNTVAANTVANAVLALGAEPSMTSSVDEVNDFVMRADAMSINLGTLSESLREAISIAVTAAVDRRIPWQLDPVFVERSPSRLSFAQQLITQSPTVIRANTREIDALGDSQQALAELIDETGAVVAVTGASDRILDQRREIHLHNGHPLMGQVTATGCAASALIAAFVAVEADPFFATAAALCALGVAGEVAAHSASAPGSFQVALIDALYNLDAEQIAETAKASPGELHDE